MADKTETNKSEHPSKADTANAGASDSKMEKLQDVQQEDTTANSGHDSPPIPQERVYRRTVIAAGAAATFLASGWLMRHYLGVPQNNPATEGSAHKDTRIDSSPTTEVKVNTVASTNYQYGYGRDPDLIEPVRHPWPDHLNPQYLKIIAALLPIVLPTSEDQADPAEAGVITFFDEWLTAPYPQQKSDIKILEELFIELINQDFLSQNTAEQNKLIAEMHAEKHEAVTRFTILAASAYFTTKAGLDEIGYIGNIPQTEFPGPPQAIIDDLELKLATL